ncbi:MAG: sulfatase-like hydrolase/transferase, partial [Pirellulales bacterium]|nr:sulfatase-like hydrolase/transferase [Pirellulales bacterium]
MNYRTLIAPVVALFFACVWTSAFAADTRPNFVVILCDDLGYGDLSCFGHPKIKTARLDRMAKEGVRLTSFYSAAPVCSPSRVGLLTGRSPNRAGVYDWIPPAGGVKKRGDNRDMVHMRRDEPTIASILKKAGYATCMSGKWHCNSRFNSEAQPQPGDAGFDHWFATQNNASPSHKNPKNFVRNGKAVGQIEGTSCQIVVDEAIGWLKKQHAASPDQPFFMYVAYHEPHEPVASPKKLVDQYMPISKNREQAEYFANVHNLDLATGRLLDTLVQLGVDKNTLVVFSSDNGPETLKRYRGAGRSYGTPAPLRGMKLWTTDAGFRISGIARWPSTIPAGKVSDEVVSALDLLPTFCALAGVDLPKNRKLDGTDCTAALKGGTIERDKPLVWCYYNAINQRRVAMRDGDWKVLARLVDENGKQLRKQTNVHPGNAEMIQTAKLADIQIFKIVDDIAEKTDLATAEPDQAKR